MTKERNEKNVYNNIEASDDDFFSDYFNYGIVFRTNLKELPAIREFLKEHAKMVIYQKKSHDKLWICDGEG